MRAAPSSGRAGTDARPPRPSTAQACRIRASSGPCTPCRCGSSTTRMRHCSGNGSRLTIGPASAPIRARRQRRDRPARTSRCRRRSARRARAGWRRRGRPEAIRGDGAGPPPPPASCVPDPRPTWAGTTIDRPRNIVRSRARRIVSIASDPLMLGTGHAQLRRGADGYAGAPTADSQADAAEATPEPAVEIQKAEMQPRRNRTVTFAGAGAPLKRSLPRFSATGFFEPNTGIDCGTSRALAISHETQNTLYRGWHAMTERSKERLFRRGGQGTTPA